MSERRNRRRLHARARSLGVPVDQVPRRGTPRERSGRSISTLSGDAPRWQDTETPDRDLPLLQDDPNDRSGLEGFVPRRPRTVSCCEVVLTRKVTEGGTVVMLTTHRVECPVWSSRP
ncbi:hypothetical protein C7C46_21840 [Streptomyces tateyamensis]|uniref:Uncharacterized protein n=1 Tax=Streptomyces tateyamensis TaxID=565073 RepID=A0A2V4MZ32_9ACTN|nr:hypothetical protein C7C46_21840 [Streptomyces tateyamensis]